MTDWHDDLRVVRMADGALNITARNNGDGLNCFGVRHPADKLDAALKVLNDGIKGWPRYPVTLEQVRNFV